MKKNNKWKQIIEFNVIILDNSSLKIFNNRGIDWKSLTIIGICSNYMKIIKNIKNKNKSEIYWKKFQKF